MVASPLGLNWAPCFHTHTKETKLKNVRPRCWSCPPKKQTMQQGNPVAS